MSYCHTEGHRSNLAFLPVAGEEPVQGRELRRIRGALGLSRVEFSRFLSVSEATIARWESDDHSSEPKGLHALLLELVVDASHARPPEEVARLVRSCGLDYRRALSTLFNAAADPPRVLS